MRTSIHLLNNYDSKMKPRISFVTRMQNPGLVTMNELRPETWTRLMVAVMRLPVGPDPGILPGSGP
jgi:hypothetical protein